MPCGTLEWATSATASRLRNHHFTFVAETNVGNFLYELGGVNGATILKSGDRAPLAADGSLGAWSGVNPLPVATGGMTGAVISGRVLIAGGTVVGNIITDLAYAAEIFSDGSLGNWAAAGSVGHPRMHPGSFVVGNRIYVLGGFNDPDVWDDVVSATVGTDGTVSAWKSAGQLPGKLSHMSVSYVDGYVFLTGGLTASAFENPDLLNNVWRGHVGADGTVGDWVAMPPLPVALGTHASFFYGGHLYAGGGINATEHEKRFWRAPIGSDHALGPWELAAALPEARGHVHQLPILGNHVYSVAGAVDYGLNSTSKVVVGTFK